jgi:ribosomal protein RSM22 (predicted rRNA methylase)
MTQGYAAGETSAAVNLSAYLTTRMPATHAAVARALDEALAALPGFSPASLLDAGCGPGTASWAAAARFTSLAAITQLDNDPRFLDVARELAAASDSAALQNATRIKADLRHLPELQADLTIAAYTLAELPEAEAAAIAAALWARTTTLLLIVEPGTPRGFARLREARQRLIAEGAFIAAPCGHEAPCPITGSDWCHFKARLARSRAHMHAKGATVPFEDEPYGYLAAARIRPVPAGLRILTPPRHSKPAITLDLCAPRGRAALRIASRDRGPYKRARKAQWGSVWSGETA